MAIYLDNAASMRAKAEALAAAMPFMAEQFGNPSSLHTPGLTAKKAIQKAREDIATCLWCKPNEIVFTSGGTESDNLAIKGYFEANCDRGKHIITTNIEHHAFFTDAVQAVGHVPFALGSSEGAGKLPAGDTPYNYLGITMLAASAHKFGGPKGVGFLFVREGTKLAPILHGGPQEMRLRGGTENVPGIVGTAAALVASCRELRESARRVRALGNMMIDRILAEIPDAMVNGSRTSRLAGNVNVSFSGVEAASVLVLMDMAGIACSGGSACTSASGEISHVIRAIGVPTEYDKGTIRMTISPETTQAEVDAAVTALAGVVAKLRAGRNY